MWQASRRLIQRRAQRWAERRQGRDANPATLASRRVYILPTAQGLVFAMLLFGMLLGSMNYNNSMGFLLTFLLGGLSLVSMHHCHRNLVGLRLRVDESQPVFAGQDAVFEVTLLNDAQHDRFGLCLEYGEKLHDIADLPAGETKQLRFSLPTESRGLVGVRRFALSTRFPFGLFRAWSWVHPDVQGVVYPRPIRDTIAPPTEHTDTGSAQGQEAGDEDFAGLRDYRAGDSPKHIAWKAFARGQELLVKQHAGTAVETHMFDWDHVPLAETEDRLSQLCRWIVDAHRDRQAYGLKMPRVLIEPNLGSSHKHRCLKTLALHGISE